MRLAFEGEFQTTMEKMPVTFIFFADEPRVPSLMGASGIPLFPWGRIALEDQSRN